MLNLVAKPDSPQTPPPFLSVAHRMREFAHLYPKRDAVITTNRNGDYQFQCFAELDQQSDQVAHAFEAAGIVRGTRTILMIPASFDYAVIAFALFKIGATVIVIDPVMGNDKIATCFAKSKAEALIATNQIHFARRMYGWGQDTLRIKVRVGTKMSLSVSEIHYGSIDKTGRRIYEMPEFDAHDIISIIYTSGNCGESKGVIYTHRMMAAQAQLIAFNQHSRAVHDIDKERVGLVTFPLYILVNASRGISSFIPEMNSAFPGDVKPENVVKPIADFDISSFFGSPALLTTLSRHCLKNNITLPTLRKVMCAGAPLADQTMQDLRAVLSPEANVISAYGALEALMISTIESRELLETEAMSAAGKGICVGRPYGGIEIKVIKNTQGPIDHWSDELLVNTDEVGEIVVCGENVADSYFDDAFTTHMHKIPVRGSDRFYHRMGDLGRMDDKGRLWFYGRKNEKISINGNVMYSAAVEGIFNRHPQVMRSALISVNDPQGQPHAVLVVEPKQRQVHMKGKAAMVEDLRDLAETYYQTRCIRDIWVTTASMPVDHRHRSKIDHAAVTDWAQIQLNLGKYKL